MVASYAICWLPYITTGIIGVKQKVVFYLAMINSITDPVIYICANRDLRSILLKKCFTSKTIICSR